MRAAITATMVPCPHCDGEGEIYYSCCGDDMKGSPFLDYNICPSCREHLGGPEVCEECNGSGLIDPENVES